MQSSQAFVEGGKPTPIVPRQSGQVGISRLSLTQHALPLVSSCASRAIQSTDRDVATSVFDQQDQVQRNMTDLTPGGISLRASVGGQHTPLRSAHQFQALFDAVEALTQAIQADADRSSVLVRMSKVAAQTGRRPFHMTDSVHNLFELAFNALLAGLKSFYVLKEQVFDVLGHGVGPRSFRIAR